MLVVLGVMRVRLVLVFNAISNVTVHDFVAGVFSAKMRIGLTSHRLAFAA